MKNIFEQLNPNFDIVHYMLDSVVGIGLTFLYEHDEDTNEIKILDRDKADITEKFKEFFNIKDLTCVIDFNKFNQMFGDYFKHRYKVKLVKEENSVKFVYADTDEILKVKEMGKDFHKVDLRFDYPKFYVIPKHFVEFWK